MGGWAGQPKSQGANLNPPPPVSLSKGLVQPPCTAPFCGRVSPQIHAVDYTLGGPLYSVILGEVKPPKTEAPPAAEEHSEASPVQVRLWCPICCMAPVQASLVATADSPDVGVAFGVAAAAARAEPVSKVASGMKRAAGVTRLHKTCGCFSCRLIFFF